MTDAVRDQNHVPVALGVSSTSATTTLPFKINPVTGRLLVDSGSGSFDLTIIAGATTVSNVDSITFVGATLVDDTGGAVTVTITGGGGGTVDTVVGTANRIVVDSTDPANPIVNISTNYVGQNTITTLGTITTGTWNGSVIPGQYGGTGVANTGFTMTVGGNFEIAGAFTFTGTVTGNTAVTFPTSGTLATTTYVPTTITVANEATDTSCFIAFFTAASGDLEPKTNANMTFDSSTGIATFASTVLTTTDINGGTIDGTIIGGASAAAGTFTTATAEGFVPTSGTTTGNRMYLVAANTLAWSINSVGEMRLTSTELSPAGDGGLSLGSTSLGWQNLFGNTGFVFNLENGDWVATHTAGILTVGTGDLRVTTAGTNTASVVTVGGTQTLTSKTLTSPTITTATLSGAQLLAEGASIQLDPTLSADGTYSGITITGTAGATLAFGDWVYLAAADSRWELTDADAASTAGAVLVGVCVLAAASDGSATTILLRGNIRADTAFPSFTISAPIYLSTTPGDVTNTAPSATDDVVRVVGFGLTADSMVVDVSPDYITIV